MTVPSNNEPKLAFLPQIALAWYFSWQVSNVVIPIIIFYQKECVYITEILETISKHGGQGLKIIKIILKH